MTKMNMVPTEKGRWATRVAWVALILFMLISTAVLSGMGKRIQTIEIGLGPYDGATATIPLPGEWECSQYQNTTYAKFVPYGINEQCMIDKCSDIQNTCYIKCDDACPSDDVHCRYIWLDCGDVCIDNYAKCLKMTEENAWSLNCTRQPSYINVTDTKCIKEVLVRNVQ